MSKKLEFLDTMAHMASLDSSYCELWHPEDKPPKADDFIIQEFKHEDGTSFTLSIPVCADCMGYLAKGQLNLIYCYGCGSSHWVVNRNPTLVNDITWIGKCKDCNNGNIRN